MLIEEVFMWNKYQDGATIGEKGTENGEVIIDEEDVDGARITLEQNCWHSIPYAITMGIYGLTDLWCTATSRGRFC